MEKFTGANFGPLIGKIDHREPRMAFQNSQVVVIIRARIEDHRRPADSDRYRFR